LCVVGYVGESAGRIVGDPRRGSVRIVGCRVAFEDIDDVCEIQVSPGGNATGIEHDERAAGSVDEVGDGLVVAFL
jgi:hypothetical protein